MSATTLRASPTRSFQATGFAVVVLALVVMAVRPTRS